MKSSLSCIEAHSTGGLDRIHFRVREVWSFEGIVREVFGRMCFEGIVREVFGRMCKEVAKWLSNIS